MRAHLTCLAACVLCSAAVEARPVVRDRLKAIPLTHAEMGGPIDGRILSLVTNHFLALDVDARWLEKFANRSETPPYAGTSYANVRYEGLGKLIDAGALLSAYTGDPAVAERTRHLVDGLRATRDADGYVGFWKPVADNRQDYINWTLHEQEYILLGLVRRHLCSGDGRALEDARIMADYIMRTFPTVENGIDATYPARYICTAGLPEGFLTLYGVTRERKYLDFAANVKHGNCNTEIQFASLRTWNQDIQTKPCHVYVMTARCNAQTELYRFTGEDALLDMSRKMRRELFAKGRGGMLVTGSCSEGEHFTYNQNGAGQIGESCVTAYMLRWLESLMRLEGDLGYGDVLERTVYNALFAALSPDGRQIRYFTPFSGERTYDTHDGGFCCCGNYRRALAELPRKVCYAGSCGALAVNLYAPFGKEFRIGDRSLALTCKTDYPNSGRVEFKVCADSEVPLMLRVPRWCDRPTVQVNSEASVPVERSSKGAFVLARNWKVGDTVTLDLPMSWRFVRGRETQAGRVALLRGPMVFCIGADRNPALVTAHPNLHDLVVDPASVGDPEPDSSVRPGGLAVRAKAWTSEDRSGDRVDVVFTEFADPSGREVYFRIPADESQIPVVDDELISL